MDKRSNSKKDEHAKRPSDQDPVHPAPTTQPDGLMFCPRCGCALTELATECPACGARQCPGCGDA